MKNWLDASSRTFGWERDSGRWLNGYHKQSEKQFRWRAKIGLARKRLTDSFPTTVSVSKRFYPDIFKQHGIVSTGQKDLFWCCMTQLHFRFSERTANQ